MAKATLVRRAVEAVPAAPEIKIEGVPYRGAREGYKADPGEVQITCSVAEAQAIACVLGRGVAGTGGVHETSWTWIALRNAVGYGPFSWEPFKVINQWGNEQIGHGYLTRS